MTIVRCKTSAQISEMEEIFQGGISCPLKIRASFYTREG